MSSYKMTLLIDELAYTLSKRVPAMECGFAIETSYGTIHIEADQAAPIIEAVRKSLENDLAYALRQREAA